MSCWVVPTIAAELWGTTVDHILKCIQDGSIPSKQEHGFTFIDVAPNSPKLVPTVMQATGKKPQTFVEAVQAEIVQNVDLPDEPAHAEEETPAYNMADWRETREAMGRQRRRPLAA